MGKCKNPTSHTRPIDTRVYKQDCTQIQQTQHTSLLNDVDLSENKTKYRCSRLECTNGVLETLTLTPKVILLSFSYSSQNCGDKHRKYFADTLILIESNWQRMKFKADFSKLL